MTTPAHHSADRGWLTPADHDTYVATALANGRTWCARCLIHEAEGRRSLCPRCADDDRRAQERVAVEWRLRLTPGRHRQEGA